MNTVVKIIGSLLYGVVLYSVLVFAPAGTVHYWQGWAFVVIAMGATTVSTVVLAIANPAAHLGEQTQNRVGAHAPTRFCVCSRRGRGASKVTAWPETRHLPWTVPGDGPVLHGMRWIGFAVSPSRP